MRRPPASLSENISNAGPAMGFPPTAVTCAKRRSPLRMISRMRLEKRLAALLGDLAKHKRMTVDACLEEMLLHTNEGVEPHTKTTLRYIQELKRKHGIDYDSHASYRFVED
jgi:hypothetical protein